MPGKRIVSKCLGLVVVLFSCSHISASPIGLAQGLLSGEMTDHSVILQSRLTSGGRQENGEITGVAGIARFEFSADSSFEHSSITEWLEAKPGYDFIVKKQLNDLEPATLYYFRLQYGPDRDNINVSEAARFRTLGGAGISRPVTFTALTCMSYPKFHFGELNKRGEVRLKPYPGLDKHLGYPSLSYIPFLEPEFVIYNGDNVYYDQTQIGGPTASGVEAMRFRWHRQFSQPRLLDILNMAGSYFLKDDHDFRFNDADLLGDREPSPATGIRIFNEQTPVVDPQESHPVTYRSRRVSKELELWFLEGRDYRSPNAMEDGPGKSIWGKVQMQWLKNTLKKSDARFKVLIVPSPLVGPDKASKTDNHTNLGGFRHEATEFFSWLNAQGFSPDELFIITGDRHWQYHSIHPSGFQEFSAGSISYANAQRVIAPGDPKGTDPEGKIRQVFASKAKYGGFLQVDVTPAGDTRAEEEFKVRFFDEWGRMQYTFISGGH